MLAYATMFLIQKIECNISKKLEFNIFYESAMLFSSLEVF